MKILKGSTTLLPPPAASSGVKDVVRESVVRHIEAKPAYRGTSSKLQGHDRKSQKYTENQREYSDQKKQKPRRSSTAADAKTNPSAGKPKVKNRKRIPRTRPRSSRPPTARRVEGARVRSRSKCVSSSAETNISKLDFKKKNQTGEGDVKNHRADLGVVTRLQLSQKTKT